MGWDMLSRILLGDPIGNDLPQQGGIFGNIMYGNDLPEQGGITGNIPFGGYGDNGIGIDRVPQIETQPQDDYGLDMLRMYQTFNPRHDAEDRLNALLNDMPERNKPGFWRILSAMVAGVGTGNPEIGRQALYAPYYKELEDWEAKFKPTVQAANQERYYNANLRQLAASAAVSKRSDKNLQRQLDRDAVLKEQGEAKLEIQRKRAEAYDFKARNPNWKAIAPKGGTVKFVNPQNPNEVVDTGIDTGTMNDYDRINLMGDLRMEQIGAQQAGANERNAADNKAAMERAELAQKGATERNQARIDAPRKPSAAATKARTQADIEKEIANKAREIASRNPQWKKYIEFDRSNRFKGVTAPGYIFGPDQKTHDDITRAIYGEGPSKKEANKINKPPSGQVPPEGWLRVRRKSDGATGKVLLKDFDPSKYEKIQ